MAPQAKRDILRLYDIYREEGLRGAANGVLRGVSNRTGENHPKTLAERAINALRPSTVIWELEWDICLILDGCRVDTFESEFTGESSRIRSVASTSQTWIPRTFGSIDCSDVAYVTANPFVGDLDLDEFAYFHLEPVRRTPYGVETVPPEALADHAIHVWRDRDRLNVDRLVVHFMQPHAPFRNQPSEFAEFLGTETWGSRVWKRLESEEVDRDEFLEAYRDNLRWVLDRGVDPIQANCDAAIALSADHGNAAGEWGYYGHPRHAPVSAVRVVPWATIDGVDTGERTPEIDRGDEPADLDEQLRALGYT